MLFDNTLFPPPRYVPQSQFPPFVVIFFSLGLPFKDPLPPSGLIDCRVEFPQFSALLFLSDCPPS